MKKIFYQKPKILFIAPVALLSLEVYFGMVIGYFISNFWSQKMKSIVFNIGKYKFHLHHWLLALWILPLVISYQFTLIPIQLTSGLLGGVIFQGIFCYDDWHRILIKIN